MKINLRIRDHGAAVAATHGVARSPYWGRVQRKFVQANPLCLACSKPHWTHSVFDHQVHHSAIPFHYAVQLGRPDLELDPANLCTFCEPPNLEHHLLIGHLGDFHSYNPQVPEFVKRYADWPAAKIKADPVWRQTAANRPKTFGLLTAVEKSQLRTRLDRLFPLGGKTPDQRIGMLVA